MNHIPSFVENSESLNPNLLEGDMIMSPQQVRGLLLGQSRGAHFVRRWPNGMVPYTIDWSLGKRDINFKVELKTL